MLKMGFRRKSAPAQATAETGGETTPEGEGNIGSYPLRLRRPENAPAREHRVQRILLTTTLALLGANLGLIAVILYLLPLQRVQPYLVQIKPYTEIAADVVPLTISTGANRVLVQDRVETYVRMYHEVTPTISWMRGRWAKGQFLTAHSTQPVYEKGSANTEMMIQELERTAFTRTVKIRSANRAGRDLWHVEFETSTTVADGRYAEPSVKRWVAYIKLARIRYRRKPTLAEQVRNPLGILVNEYNYRPVETD